MVKVTRKKGAIPPQPQLGECLCHIRAPNPNQAQASSDHMGVPLALHLHHQKLGTHPWRQHTGVDSMGIPVPGGQ